MIIAILSDIHSNLQALESVLERCKRLEANQIWCLGDVVGYGPNPWECWELLNSNPQLTQLILGNHEYALENAEETAKFSAVAQAGIRHAQAQLKLPKNKSLRQKVAGGLLKRLPLTAILPEFNVGLTHAEFVDPIAWDYVETAGEIKEQANALPAGINFLGHTHLPFVYKNKGHGLLNKLQQGIALEENFQYLINPGSVGQPRDQDWRASFGILEITPEKKVFSLKRVEYNLSKALLEVEKAGLPPEVANRLKRNYKGEY